VHRRLLRVKSFSLARMGRLMGLVEVVVGFRHS
jgi:hypothetical protein